MRSRSIRDLEQYDTERRTALKAAAIEAASNGLKALMLLNGGACVAILAFLANVFGEAMDTDRERLFQAALSSLLLFALGAAAEVGTGFFAYWSNQAYANALQFLGQKRHALWRRGQTFNIIGAFVGAVALGLFLAGVVWIWLAL